MRNLRTTPFYPNYLGISFALESLDSGAAALLAAASSPFGACAGRGCDSTAFCITLPDVFGLFDARYARERLVTKKTVARIAVERLRKLAEPVAPKRLPDAPLPKAAPMSAPLPCWTRTNPHTARPTRICTTTTIENRASIYLFAFSFFQRPAERQIARKSSITSEAPPISPPSMSAIAKNSAAF